MPSMESAQVRSPDVDRRHRSARLPVRSACRAGSRRRLRARPQGRQTPPSARFKEEYTRWNTARRPLKCIKTPSSRASVCLIVDDLLATGGTALAAARLVERLGGTVVGLSFLIELGFLGGRQALGRYDVQALLTY